MAKEKLKEKLKEQKLKLKEQRKKLRKNAGSFFAEFKQFIAKGNVIDLSVAVVIGAAFNKIVSSLVNDVIMPIISLVVGGNSVEDWKWVIKPAGVDELGNATAETALKYGVFIQTIIDFLIVALTIFVILKVFLRSQKKFRELSEKVVKNIEKKFDDNESLEQTQETIEQVQETIDETQSEVDDIAQKVNEVQTNVTEANATNSEQTELLKEIRDLLAKNSERE